MNLCVIEGDGISHDVIPAALEVLEAVVPDLRVHSAPAGWEYFKQTQKPMDDGIVDLALQCGAVLVGKASSPPYAVEGYYSPIVRLRRLLKTHANIRPTAYVPVPTAREGVDLIVVRENTEDIYAGEEFTHDDGSAGTVQKLVTRAASEKVARTAYKLAQSNERRRVTIVHKGNVLPKTDGLFREAALSIAAQYPDIETDELLVDTAAYWMVKDPTRFDVILTLNQYGDILSDMAAAWGGGLGLAPALSLGDGIAIAEPVHGSAPDIAGKSIANPTASILSVALLLRYHWGMLAQAQRIEAAVHQALQDGCYTADIRAHNPLTTRQFTDAVLARL